MNMRNMLIGLAGLGIVAALVAVALSGRQKMGVIRLEYVFEHFEGARLAAKELMESSEKYETTIDSLNYRLSALLGEQEEEAARLRRTIYELSRKAEYNRETLNSELSLGVQNQIDTYLEMYRKERGYDVLFSQYQSTGAVAARPELDITEDFTQALNNYYFHE